MSLSFRRVRIVLYVNSFASAVGPTDASALVKRDAGEPQACASLLSAKYILATGNADPAQARNHMLVSPATLAAQAAHVALERAGITLEQIGLVIADTTTPLELIPSEAQRICKELDVKVASFDINTAGVGLPVLFETLASWKEDRLEKPVLCISVHALTMTMDFSTHTPSFPLLGDAAVAAIVSRTRKGFELREAFSFELPAGTPYIEVPINGHAILPDAFSAVESRALSQIKACFVDSKPDVSIAAAASAKDIAGLESSFDMYGNTLGAGLGMSIEPHLAASMSGTTIAAFAPGCGIRAGGFLVAKV